MGKRFRTIFITLAATAALAAGARAEPAVLRGDVVVYKPIVTIGDFFENAGEHAIKPLFRSPDPGNRGSVPVWQIMERVSALGMTELDTRGLAFVDVTRASRYLTGQDFVAMAKSAIAERLGGVELKNLEIEVSAVPEPIHADATVAEPVALRSLRLAGRSGQFLAQFSVDDGIRRQDVILQGVARETRQVVVLSRPVARGEIIADEDVIEARINATQVNERSAVSADQLVGMQAQRNLREGAAVNTADLREPNIIERNQPVTIIYRTPNMVLSAQGRALEAGARNDFVNVLNIQSKRTVQARVSATGEVTVAPRTTRIASAKE